MTEPSVPTTGRPRRKFLGVLLAGAGAVLALPSLIIRKPGGRLRAPQTAKTGVHVHPSAVPRTPSKDTFHG